MSPAARGVLGQSHFAASVSPHPAVPSPTDTPTYPRLSSFLFYHRFLSSRLIPSLPIPSHRSASLTPLPIASLAPQANNNEIATLPVLPPAKFPELTTLYLEGNPVQKTMATTYVRKITLEMPQLRQVDANFVRRA